MSALGDVLHGCPVAQEDIDKVRDTVLFVGPDFKVRLVRFFVLLTMASAIAAFGLLGDSVATVIGAMIVAPLMLPIMGLAYGISVGDRKAVLSSIGVAIGGILAAILVGYLIGFLTDASFDPTAVTQIITRTSPRLMDLAAALATGLAGAFAIGRKDVSDTLPGVAIAISLVPPLANVGILLSTGYPDLAMGSLLLFVTNYFAILLTGALVFGLMGYPAAVLKGEPAHSKRLAMTVVIVMLLIIAVPLGFQSWIQITERTVRGRVAQATEDWLGASDYRLISVTIDDAGVTVVVAGQGLLPPEAALQRDLEGQIYGLDVRLERAPLAVTTFSTTTTDTAAP